MTLVRFLCIAVDRVSGATLAEYMVDSTETYFARHQAARRFETEHPDIPPGTWHIDSLDLSTI